MDRETLTTRPVTRRQVLAGGALAGVAAFLAACTGSAESSSSAPVSIAVPTVPPSSPTPAPASPTPVPSPTGPLSFANWPAYIDLSGKAYDTEVYTPGSSPTIEQFKKQYG